MTPLARILAERIAATGPITLAEYMGECLLHPQHGYYATRDPLGASGDFTTAPEISQMFGELIGLCLAQAWIDRGRPAPSMLAEVGPGRGTLMTDVLRAIRSVAGMVDAIRLHLVEASEPLHARQAQALAGRDVTWHRDLSHLPHQPIFLIANEFLDALPVRQFVRAGDQWQERMVGLGSGALTFGLAPPSPRPELAHRLADTSDGDMIEVCAPALASVIEVANRIAGSGGVAIFVDYGGWRSRGDTLQALRAHKMVAPLATPGEADLTCHVDFEAVATVAHAAGVSVTPMVPQGVFLERLGITARAQNLALSLSGDALTSHIAAHRRLTHPEEMGSLFKVIALHDGKPPPGFES